VIGRLRGSLVARTETSVIVDVAGVGYEVAVTPRTLAVLPGVGEDAVVHTHLLHREDSMALFGFATEHERDVFRILLGASGVGPKVALAICATLTPSELQTAVVAEDAATLEMVPGIGKRGAQKLIIELRPKLDLPPGELPGSAPSVLADVRQALDALGYGVAEVRDALGSIPAEGTAEELVRAALQHLGAER
jgi:Holliday junction DNA helicase RuvA